MGLERKEPEIIILGLGPGDPDLLTIRAAGVLEKAKEIYLRTEDHPTIKGLPEGLETHSFDWIYEEEGQYQAVYKRIAEEVISLAKSQSPVIIRNFWIAHHFFS